MSGTMKCRLSTLMKPVLRALVVSAATIGLCGALMTAPAVADHKPNHNPGGGGGGGDGDGGGDATYEITLTDVTNQGVVVAVGVGVDGPGGTIDGITEPGSFEVIELALISTDGSDTPLPDNITADYNHLCGDVVNDLNDWEEIDNIRVVHDAEIDTLTVPVEYMVGDQSFTLLLQGPYGAELVFPPTVPVDLTIWNNRGGGKGKNNRCGSGFRSLAEGGVTLEIVPQ